MYYTTIVIIVCRISDQSGTSGSENGDSPFPLPLVPNWSERGIELVLSVLKEKIFRFRETARKFCFIFPLKIYALLPMHIFVTIINQILNWENENNWNAFKNENKRQESKPKSKKNLHKFYSCTQLYANPAHPNIPCTKDYRTNLYW